MAEIPVDNHPEDINRFERFTELAGLQVEDPEARISALRELDVDKFLDVLSVSNGLLRGEKKFQRWQGEAAEAQVTSMVLGTDIEPPENAHEIFKNFYDTFQSELQPDEVNLQKSAVEMYFAIIGSHMFADGNGRLARAAYYLIKDGRLPDEQSDILERSQGVTQAAQAVNSGTIGLLLQREGIDYQYVNEFAADEKEADEDGVFAEGGFTQQLKYIAARRVMQRDDTWPDTPPETIGLRNWPEDKMERFQKEYATVQEEWLTTYVEYAGSYAPALSRLIENTSESDSFANTVKFMKRFRAEEIFQTPERSKAFLDSLTFDDFKRWLSFVNGVERGIPRSERGFRGGSLVYSESALLGNDIEYQPPYEQHREPLMEVAFEKAQQIDDPSIAGLTLGFAINAIHPYPDGNGRTARMVTALLSRGYDGSPKSTAYYSSLLQNLKGREVINPNPSEKGVETMIAREMYQAVAEHAGYTEALRPPAYVSGGYGDAMAGEYTPEELAVSPDISPAGRKNLHLVMRDGLFGITSFMRTFAPNRLEPFLEADNRGIICVNADKLLPTLTEDEVVALAKSNIVVKRSYVKRLIDFSDRENAAEIVDSYL